MKRKFISVEANQKKRKIYLDDLTKIHQLIQKKHKRIPSFNSPRIDS